MNDLKNILTQEELAKVHEASLKIISEVGIKIEHQVALEKLSDAGARVDFQKQIACFPPALVEKAIKEMRREFTCAGRTPEFDISMGPKREFPVIRTGGGCISIFDVHTGKGRPLTMDDSKDIAVLADGLPNIDVLCHSTPSDVPPETNDLHSFYQNLKWNRKHIWGLQFDSAKIPYQVEMADIATGHSDRSRPCFTGIFCLLSPLHIAHDEIECLFNYHKYNLPTRIPMAGQSGTTAPYSVAGTVVQTNAEILGSCAMMQLLCPGIKTWYHLSIKTMHMKNTNISYQCSPESLLAVGACLQLARHYNLPSSFNGLVTSGCDTHQVALQQSLALSLGYYGGSSEIYGAGYLDNSIHYAHEALLMTDEMVGFFKRLAKGFSIDTNSMAVDVIKKVGHGGNFLAEPHTLEYLRKEPPFLPSLLDWDNYATWEKKGSSNILERARDKKEQILKSHTEQQLDEKTLKELDKVMEAANKEFL